MKKALKQVIHATGLQRRHVAATRMYCERHFLAITSGIRSIRARSIGRILCYHSIGQPATGVNDVGPNYFAGRSSWRFVRDFGLSPLRRSRCTGGSPMDLAITFDDGWTSVLSAAAPILRDYNIPWLLFVVSSWSDHRSGWAKEFILPWRDIERLLADGVQIGSHSVTHPDFGAIERTQMIDELCGSRETIQTASRLCSHLLCHSVRTVNELDAPWRASLRARQVSNCLYAQAEETRPSGTIPRTFVTRFDGDRIFNALLRGAYDQWEEWV